MEEEPLYGGAQIMPWRNILHGASPQHGENSIMVEPGTIIMEEHL